MLQHALLYHGVLCTVCQKTRILVPVGRTAFPVCKYCKEKEEKSDE